MGTYVLPITQRDKTRPIKRQNVRMATIMRGAGVFYTKAASEDTNLEQLKQ